MRKFDVFWPREPPSINCSFELIPELVPRTLIITTLKSLDADNGLRLAGLRD